MSVDETAALTASAVRGAAAGLAGVTAMTAAEKLEQMATGRRTPGPGTAQPPRPDGSRRGHARVLDPRHALGTGALIGTLRGVWAVTGQSRRGITSH